MKKLIIIRGNSGSGKTSLAKSLHEIYKENSLLICQDIIRREMLSGNDLKASELLLDLIKFGFDNYEITILEGILVYRKYKTLFKKIKDIYATKDIYTFYYDLSFQETVNRHYSRAIKDEFNEETMKQWFVEKDYLNDFNETIFDSTISLEKAIDIIKEKII